mmetsp:Transcript_11210/g.26948  ORF Transcript_11210/g.26948 Transcript_11210/m.26948 type:complete len:224 (-) Transcript_11210:195-866(-)|eukprot:CAMPEP_0197180786 /NCGR_PEP_ID=MMETSP1423-20130617/5275_1 /TAXON_ID=476441 /ORGANISM="Pseudo-nitzschia heimii, Strain UNC1101" /LENGTH=223 /DNA_ID=CAMNT_0042630911 /DNA_START=157 /DNA_END=828 /DNA_ORIENTATION=-
MKWASECLVSLILAILSSNISQVASFQTSQYDRYQCGHDRSIPRSMFPFPKSFSHTKRVFRPLRMTDIENGKDEFWQQQRELMNEMSDRNDKSLKEEQNKNFNKVQNALIIETIFFSSLLFSLLWLACDNPFVPLSYVFGSIFGIAYAYGLGKYVETVGGTIDDASAVEGAGVGQARFAFLILLFVFVGKFRAYGLLEIPSIAGFFTYQLASLSQGFKEQKID